MTRNGLLLASLAACFLAACVSAPLPQPQPVAASALALANQARGAERIQAWDQAMELWQAAEEQDPSWVLPQRAQQVLALQDDRGPEVLERALARYSAELPGSPYLLARLGRRNPEAYQSALRVDPGNAWLHHGFSVQLSSYGRRVQALAESRLAVRLARSGPEKVLFLGVLARHAFLQDTREGPSLAFDVMLDVWQSLDAEQCAWFDLSLLLLKQGVAGDRKAWQRALALRLLGEPLLTATERQKVAAVLGEKDRFLREALGKERLQGQSLAAGTASSFLVDLGDTSSVKKARAVFRSPLPPQALGPDGRPRDQRLARVDLAFEQLEESPSIPHLGALGQAFLAAGHPDWAISVAQALQRQQADGVPALLSSARLLESRQRAFATALDDLRIGRLDQTADLDAPPKKPGRRSVSSFHLDEQSGDMDQILAALDRRLKPYDLAGRVFPQEAAWDLDSSPRIDLWPILTGIAGADDAGVTPPGLAQLARDLGFYVQVLAPTGQDIQTRLARVLLQEKAAGELLGRPWHGTRILLGEVQGSSRNWGISGAALPGQYWVLMPEIVRNRTKWQALARRFEGRPQAVAGALNQTGLLPGSGVGITAIGPCLGQANRVALAVMAPQDQGETLVVPTLEDLLDVTQRHEEGHMADYEEWLPPDVNLWGILDLFWQGGLSVRGIWARVEARAELAALCVVADPRLVLVQLLRLVEEREQVGSSGVYPHADGYAWMLKQLLLELKRNPRGLDPKRSLLHQLHRLDPEDLRAAALVLAEAEGLVRP